MKKCLMVFFGVLLCSTGAHALNLDSLAEIKAKCPEFITAVLPDNLLAQSKYTCRSLTESDRRQLKDIDNKMAELGKTIASFQSGGVAIYPAGFDPEYEKAELLTQYINVFIQRARKCQAGL